MWLIVDCVDDARGIYEEAKHIFRRATMNLREWNYHRNFGSLREGRK